MILLVPISAPTNLLVRPVTGTKNPPKEIAEKQIPGTAQDPPMRDLFGILKDKTDFIFHETLIVNSEIFSWLRLKKISTTLSMQKLNRSSAARVIAKLSQMKQAKLPQIKFSNA